MEDTTTKNEMKVRNKLQEKARETKRKEDWNKFKKKRNRVNNILKDEKIINTKFNFKKTKT